MNLPIFFILMIFSMSILFVESTNDELNLGRSDDLSELTPVTRNKRTLFLKKKLLGVGALGFGLGIGFGALKGYKYGHGGYGGYGGHGYGGYGGYGGYNGYNYGSYGGYGSYGSYRPSYYNKYPYHY